MDKVHIEFTLNRKAVALDIPTQMTALAVIREVIGLTGTKEGCGVGECGACTIEVDGQAVNACLMLGAQLDRTVVLTVEGLALNPAGSAKDAAKMHLHRIQEAFLDNHGVQCGFCTPGILMSAHALLTENPSPDDGQIKKAIAGNICRCTGYQHIFSSVKAACSAESSGDNLI
jgi:carbon-monoxide dehydrogenase small subunit